MAFMDLDSKALPLQLWQTLAAEALGAGRRRAKLAVADKFYDLYENAGPNRPASDVPPYLDPDIEAEVWKALAKAYEGKDKLNTILGDKSKGFAETQGDASSHMARVYETYNQRPLVGRFQFVVYFGGGTILFNRMRRACQTALQKRGRVSLGAFCVQSWKVFGAAAGVGRSDSCVVYLADPYGSPEVQEFIKDHLWPSINDVVANQFRPYGLCEVQPGRPVFGLDYPEKDKFQRVLNLDATTVGNNYTSAGGMMGLYLGWALSRVDRSLFERCQGPGGSDSIGDLIAAAKVQAAQLMQQLE